MTDPTGASGANKPEMTPNLNKAANLPKTGRKFNDSPSAASPGSSENKPMTMKEMWDKLYSMIEMDWNTSLKRMMAQTKKALNKIKQQAENQ